MAEVKTDKTEDAARQAAEWKVVHDGDSMGMLEHKSRCFTIEEFRGGKWQSAEDHEVLLGEIVKGMNAAHVSQERDAEFEKLAAFKKYVHDRLDAAGVPSNPDPEQNARHGCTIEGRLNFVLSASTTLRAQLEGLRVALTGCVEHLEGLWGQLRTQEEEPGWQSIDAGRAALASVESADRKG